MVHAPQSTGCAFAMLGHHTTLVLSVLIICTSTELQMASVKTDTCIRTCTLLQATMKGSWHTPHASHSPAGGQYKRHAPALLHTQNNRFLTYKHTQSTTAFKSFPHSHTCSHDPIHSEAAKQTAVYAIMRPDIVVRIQKLPTFNGRSYCMLDARHTRSPQPIVMLHLHTSTNTTCLPLRRTSCCTSPQGHICVLW